MICWINIQLILPTIFFFEFQKTFSPKLVLSSSQIE